jgi:hypothetical protein
MERQFYAVLVVMLLVVISDLFFGFIPKQEVNNTPVCLMKTCIDNKGEVHMR